MKKRILTGITTTGTPHIGNYLGAIKPAIKMASEFDESFYFLADYHAIIKNSNSNEIGDSVKNIALAWIASGLDIEKSFFYRQSDVPEILELSWVLNCVTAKGLMNRSHAYKAATALNTKDEDKGITMGLFSYPVLMAADILMFDATHVPVGADQNQHIEMTRDIAARFNHTYKKIFELPEAIIETEKDIVLGIDGRKMSKSYNNTIPIFDDSKKIRKRIMKIVTDLAEINSPKDKNTSLFKIYSLFLDNKEKNRLIERYDLKGLRYGDIKLELYEKIMDYFKPYRDKRNFYLSNPKKVEEILKHGAKKAKTIAIEVLDRIRSATGISYKV